jgi:hypothetical protein
MIHPLLLLHKWVPGTRVVREWKLGNELLLLLLLLLKEWIIAVLLL